MMNEDWRYTDDRLKLRGQCLKVLLNKYGSDRIEETAYMNVQTLGYHKEIKQPVV